MTDDATINPDHCPFCKATYPLHVHVDDFHYNNLQAQGTIVFVVCDRCGARGPTVEVADERLNRHGEGDPSDAEQAEAIRLWNNRVEVQS